MKNISGSDSNNYIVGKLWCSDIHTIPIQGIVCLALAHNEAHILQQFLTHYRDLGVEHFLIVDDHSNDTTNKILEDADDVTIFIPLEGSPYRADKVDWRCDLLDKFAINRWVLLPDLDEHLVYPQMETINLQELASKMDRQGAQALYTTMIDMYDDRPLNDHVFQSGKLIDAFPYFDRPASPAESYRVQPPARRFLKRYPTPCVHVYGGLRERQFFKRKTQKHGKLPIQLLNRFAHLARPLNPGFFSRISNAITRTLTKRNFPDKPFTLTKLGMIKWQKGMRFSGGPHAVSKKIQLANITAAFLHFKFTKGTKGLEYTAKRGQHAGGGMYYKQMLNHQELLSDSPYSSNSLKYTSSQTLVDCGLMRDDQFNSNGKNIE